MVAQSGSLWIEVKDLEKFGVGSSRWRGKAGLGTAGMHLLIPHFDSCYFQRQS